MTFGTKTYPVESPKVLWKYWKRVHEEDYDRFNERVVELLAADLMAASGYEDLPTEVQYEIDRVLGEQAYSDLDESGADSPFELITAD